ncbi:MAG TPA: ROK family protein [Ktedonobacteraceae bacterium]|nr:ROK family protein [Ktedonobacteraceae bacterium]
MPGQRITADNNVAISVEMGGSKAALALVDRAGRVRQRRYAKILWNRPVAATVEPCLRSIDEMLIDARREGFRVRGIAVSLPGSLDLTSRRPLLIPTLPSLNGYPLCDFLEARYDLPAILHVDVDAAVLGEYYFGAGRGFRRLLLLSANAVVGASLVIDGQIEPAAPGHVGHICHLSVSGSGPRCGCGKRGCINTLVTLDAVQKMLQRALRRGEQSSLLFRLTHRRESFSFQMMAEEAEAGDLVASQIYTEICRWLGAATARYIDLFEPNMLILGGIFSSSELLLARVRRSLVTASSARVCSMVEVEAATLGQDAILLGAAATLML